MSPAPNGRENNINTLELLLGCRRPKPGPWKWTCTAVWRPDTSYGSSCPRIASAVCRSTAVCVSISWSPTRAANRVTAANGKRSDSGRGRMVSLPGKRDVKRDSLAMITPWVLGGLPGGRGRASVAAGDVVGRATKTAFRTGTRDVSVRTREKRRISVCPNVSPRTRTSCSFETIDSDRSLRGGGRPLPTGPPVRCRQVHRRPFPSPPRLSLGRIF